jgi:hypothetical protein
VEVVVAQRGQYASVMVVNNLSLNDAELDALRGLQDGNTRIAFDDPIWDELADIGLVAPQGARAWTLTMRGRLYRTA